MWLLAASPGACVDSHPQCSDFAALGECESNAASMRTLCARSCDFCRDPAAPACHDRRQECPVWTRLGLCARYYCCCYLWLRRGSSCDYLWLRRGSSGGKGLGQHSS